MFVPSYVGTYESLKVLKLKYQLNDDLLKIN